MEGTHLGFVQLGTTCSGKSAAGTWQLRRRFGRHAMRGALPVPYLPGSPRSPRPPTLLADGGTRPPSRADDGACLSSCQWHSGSGVILALTSFSLEPDALSGYIEATLCMEKVITAG